MFWGEDKVLGQLKGNATPSCYVQESGGFRPRLRGAVGPFPSSTQLDRDSSRAKVQPT